MKWLFSYLFVCFVFFLSAQDTIIIKPGVGIDDIKIGSKSIFKVERTFHILPNSRGRAIYCGTGKSSQAKSAWLVDTVNGTWFFYKGRIVNRRFLLPSTRRLKEIWIQSGSTARLENGLELNKSTIYDVLGIYGDEIPETGNCTFLKYDERGISFTFTDEGILKRVVIFEGFIDE